MEGFDYRTASIMRRQNYTTKIKEHDGSISIIYKEFDVVKLMLLLVDTMTKIELKIGSTVILASIVLIN